MNIERLRELLSKATPGPWVFDGEGINHASKIVFQRDWEDDAQLITEAINALPELLDQLEDLQHYYGITLCANEQLRARVQELEHQINNYLTYGEGGATFKEAQLLEKLYQAEARIEMLEYELAHRLFDEE